MAINGSAVQSASTTSGSTTTSPSSLTVDGAVGWAAPTSGNILVAIASSSAGSATGFSYSQPSGFTVIQDHTANAVKSFVAWKVSDGTETSLTSSYTFSGTLTNWNLTIIEFDPTDLSTSSVHASAEDTTNVSTVVTSQSSGSATLSTASGLAIAIACSTRQSFWTTGLSWSNSYVAQVHTNATNTARANVMVATKVLSSSGSTSSTVSTSGTGGAAYGVILLFEGTASAGHNKLSGKLGYPLRGKLG